MRSMTESSKCDTCQVNDAYYYVAGVYSCAPCAIEAIKAKLPPEYRNRPLYDVSGGRRPED